MIKARENLEKRAAEAYAQKAEGEPAEYETIEPNGYAEPGEEMLEASTR